MFERFAQGARQTVTDAQAEARRLRAQHIGTEHLLLALLAQDTLTAAVLARHGVTHDAAAKAITDYLSRDDLGADALRTPGIGLEAVPDDMGVDFGSGAPVPRSRRGRSRQQSPTILEFTSRAEKALELALREALALGDRSVSEGHILLGLLREDEGLPMQLLHDRGVDPAALRQDVIAALRP